jgi:hypothetical protein
MIDVGCEVTTAHALPQQIDDDNSMWNFYMQTADLNKIGDSVLAEKHIERIHQFEKDAEERIIIENFVSVSPYHYVISNNSESYPITELTLENPSSTETDYFDNIL